MFSNFIRKKLLPIYQGSVRNVHKLQFLFIELTNKCNLECIHCGSDCQKNSDIPDLSSEAIIKALSEIKSKYDPNKITVALSGGEPLCYPQVFELGKRINELGFPWGMVTNGYSWSLKTLKDAFDAGMRTITVSLDGFAKDHDWLRGKKGSFKKAVDLIKMLVSNPRYQDMDIITCVNKRNLHSLDDLHDFVKQLGIKAWRFFIISPIGRAISNQDLFLEGEEFKLLMDKIVEMKKRNEMKVNFSEAGYLGPLYEKRVRNHDFFCQAGISVAGIMVNGDILACPNIDRRFSQGNIHKDSFVDIWENKYKIFRKRAWMRQGECKNCKEWGLCQGNGIHFWDKDKNKPKICHIRDFDLL